MLIVSVPATEPRKRMVPAVGARTGSSGTARTSMPLCPASHVSRGGSKAVTISIAGTGVTQVVPAAREACGEASLRPRRRGRREPR